VSKLADLERLIATTVKAFGRLDIMVNNAGIETRTTILETTEQQYAKVLQVNLRVHSSEPSLPPPCLIIRLAEHPYAALGEAVRDIAGHGLISHVLK